MHKVKTYTDEFNGKSYAVLMLQREEGSRWVVEASLFDETGSRMGPPWRDSANSYANEEDARQAGCKWAQAQLA